MGGMGHFFKAMGLPVDEITTAAAKLITIAQEIKAQLDRIENRLASLERHSYERGTPAGDWRQLSNGCGTSPDAEPSERADGHPDGD